MKKHISLLITTAILLLSINSAMAAAYIKFEGVDGESKESHHDKWIEVMSISQASLNPGQILIGLNKDGKRIPLTQDGRYSTADGKTIIIVNGKVSAVQSSGQRMPVPGSTQGFNPQPDPPKAKSMLSNPVQTKGLNPQPEPPTNPIGADAAKKAL